jgi:hypothetical protein
MRYHQAGQLSHAEALYRQILAVNFPETEALQPRHGLATDRRSEAAIGLAKPRYSPTFQMHFNLGLAYRTLEG